MFRLSKKGAIQFFKSEAFEESDFLTHAFLTRWKGSSEGKFSSLNFSLKEGDREDRVNRNWGMLAEVFGASASQFLMINQIHGDRVVVAEDLSHRSSSDLPLQCDAVLTAAKGVALGIKTADCVPVLLVDKVKRVIGAVHAGWRGTSLHIVAKAIRAFETRFSSSPSDILAAIGPAIGPCCYQVDEQVFSAAKEDKDWMSAFRACSEKGRWMLDLPLVNRLQLLRVGVPPENISSADICTSCRTDLFFSHRAEKGGTGRQLNFIILEGNSR